MSIKLLLNVTSIKSLLSTVKHDPLELWPKEEVIPNSGLRLEYFVAMVIRSLDPWGRMESYNWARI